LIAILEVYISLLHFALHLVEAFTQLEHGLNRFLAMKLQLTVFHYNLFVLSQFDIFGHTLNVFVQLMVFLSLLAQLGSALD